MNLPYMGDLPFSSKQGTCQKRRPALDRGMVAGASDKSFLM
jgi:hypothetical protein